jgi:hypothetical protein
MSKRHTKKGAYVRTRKSELRAEALQYASERYETKQNKSN